MVRSSFPLTLTNCQAPLLLESHVLHAANSVMNLCIGEHRLVYMSRNTEEIYALI